MICFLLSPNEPQFHCMRIAKRVVHRQLLIFSVRISWFAMQSFITELSSPAKLARGNNSVTDVTERKWTATRCNRLLRPLSSKLALLRREQQLIHLGEQERKLSRCKASDPGNGLRMDNESDAIAAKSEEGWPSPRPTKRIKRTYSSRDAAQARRQRVGGPQIDQLDNAQFLGIPTIGMPQHAWKGHIREFDQASLSRAAVDLSLSASATLSKHAGFQVIQAQDRLVRTEHLKLIERIGSALGSFLRATSECSTSVACPSGTRSLFSTCLRRVPDYISDEELECKTEESDNALGISSTIYNDLEAFGSSPRGGWKPLREVVRSHGISLLCAAINQGHITAPEARYFVNVCLRCRAFDEAERLVEYILNGANRTFPSPSPVISVFDLVTLDLFARITVRYGFQYRQLTRLLRHGYLPCGWMSGNEMVPCWNRLIASLTKANNESIDAAILLRTALSIGYCVSGLPFAASQIHRIRLHAKGLLRSDGNLYNPNGQRSPSNALTLNEDLDQAFCATGLHLLTVLTTVEIIPSLTSLLETNGFKKVDVLQFIALDVLQAFEVNEFETNSGKASQLPRHHDGLYLPVLAAGIVLATVGKKEYALSQGIYQHPDLLKCFKTSQEFVDTAASFICTVVNCCGQAGTGDVFYYIQEIVNLLIRRQLFFLGSDLQTRRLLEQIAVTAAVRFSQATSLPKHLSWALDLESTFHCVRVGHERQTPIKPSERKARSGYKWEEGICEWVAGTPCIPTPKPKLASNAASNIFDRERGAILPSCFSPKLSPSISEEVSLSPRLVPCGGKGHPGVITDCLRTSPSELSSSEWFLRVEITHSSQRKCETILQAPIQKNSKSENPHPACPQLARIATHIMPLLKEHPISQENIHQFPSSSSISESSNRISAKRHRPLLQTLSSSCITTKTSWTRRLPLAAVDTNNALSTVESEDELGVL